MLRANYLYYSTYGFQAERYYGPSGWEHMQIEGRMLLDHLKRKDTEAAALICSSHFDRILLNTNSIQGFYPLVLFRLTKMADSKNCQDVLTPVRKYTNLS